MYTLNSLWIFFSKCVELVPNLTHSGFFFNVRIFLVRFILNSNQSDVDSFSKARIEFQKLNWNVSSKTPQPWQTSLRPYLKHQYIFQCFLSWIFSSGYPLHGMLGHTWDSHVTGVVLWSRACACWWCTRPRPSASPCSPGATPGGTARDPGGSYPVPPLECALGKATAGRTCCL